MFSKNFRNTYLDTYRGFKHFLAIKRAKMFSEARHEHLMTSGITHCEKCGKYLKYSQRTIDHIIPMSIIMEKELYGLWLDRRNFQVLCYPCNVYKSHDTSELPDLVKDKLKIPSGGYN